MTSVKLPPLSKALAKARGPRDLLETPPAVPDRAEVDILVELLPNHVLHRNAGEIVDEQMLRPSSYEGTLSTFGKGIDMRLAARRMAAWGWVNMYEGLPHQVGPLLMAGYRALESGLVALEAAGDKTYLSTRLRLFPTPEDIETAKRARENAERERDADNRRYSLGQCVHTLECRNRTRRHAAESRMMAIAVQLSKGANDVDDLLAELRKLGLEITEVEAAEARATDYRTRVQAMTTDDLLSLRPADKGYGWSLPWDPDLIG